MWCGQREIESLVAMGPRLRGDDSGWFRANKVEEVSQALARKRTVGQRAHFTNWSVKKPSYEFGVSSGLSSPASTLNAPRPPSRQPPRRLPRDQGQRIAHCTCSGSRALSQQIAQDLLRIGNDVGRRVDDRVGDHLRLLARHRA